MITKQKLISDIQLQLTQGSPSDDFQLEDEQIAQWVTYHLNDLVSKQINAYLRQGKAIPPVFIKRQVAVSLTEEAVADVDDEKQRMYGSLSEEVLDLPNDAGIVQVQDYDHNLIHKATLERYHMINALRFAKPSMDNKLYYRQGEVIFVEGFKTADLEFNDILVDYVPKQDVYTMSDSTEILITDELVPILIDLCVQRGKLQMYGTQVDTASDGTDNKQPVYHTAIANPGRQQAQQPTEE